MDCQGVWLLYDACFGIGPIPVAMDVPVADENITASAADVAQFRASYLDANIDYLLGSLYNDLTFYESLGPAERPPEGKNGMTVRTRDIPAVVNGAAGVTLRWSE